MGRTVFGVLWAFERITVPGPPGMLLATPLAMVGVVVVAARAEQHLAPVRDARDARAAWLVLTVYGLLAAALALVLAAARFS